MIRAKIDHQARRERILVESIRLFAKKGYPAVNMGMIAAAVGLSRPLLYTYYRDKLIIFNEAISGVTSRIEAKYAEVMRSRQCADAKLRHGNHGDEHGQQELTRLAGVKPRRNRLNHRARHLSLSTAHIIPDTV